MIYKEGSDPVSRKKKEALQGIIYVLPSFILIMAFCIIPIFMSGYFSFTSYNIMTPPKFVGLENYEKVFQDGYVADAAKNTLLYVLMTVPAQTILSLVFAAFLAYKMQNKTGGFFKKCYVYSGNCISSYSGNHLEDYFKYRGWVVKQHLKIFFI